MPSGELLPSAISTDNFTTREGRGGGEGEQVLVVESTRIFAVSSIPHRFSVHKLREHISQSWTQHQALIFALKILRILHPFSAIFLHLFFRHLSAIAGENSALSYFQLFRNLSQFKLCFRFLAAFHHLPAVASFSDCCCCYWCWCWCWCRCSSRAHYGIFHFGHSWIIMLPCFEAALPSCHLPPATFRQPFSCLDGCPAPI